MNQFYKFLKRFVSEKYSNELFKEESRKLHYYENDLRMKTTTDLIEMKIDCNLMLSSSKLDFSFSYLKFIAPIFLAVLIGMATLGFNIVDSSSKLSSHGKYVTERLGIFSTIMDQINSLNSRIVKNHYINNTDRYKEFIDEWNEFLKYVSSNTNIIVLDGIEGSNLLNKYYEIAEHAQAVSGGVSNYIEDILAIEYSIFDLNNTLELTYLAENMDETLKFFEQFFIYMFLFILIVVVAYLIVSRIHKISFLDSSITLQRQELIIKELERRKA